MTWNPRGASATCARRAAEHVVERGGSADVLDQHGETSDSGMQEGGLQLPSA